MPEAAMQRAEALSSGCDLFLAIGSSLVGWPAAGFPLLAKRSGARLVVLNREATDFDDVADLVIRADISQTLHPFFTPSPSPTMPPPPNSPAADHHQRSPSPA